MAPPDWRQAPDEKTDHSAAWQAAAAPWQGASAAWQAASAAWQAAAAAWQAASAALLAAAAWQAAAAARQAASAAWQGRGRGSNPKVTPFPLCNSAIWLKRDPRLLPAPRSG